MLHSYFIMKVKDYFIQYQFNNGKKNKNNKHEFKIYKI